VNDVGDHDPPRSLDELLQITSYRTSAVQLGRFVIGERIAQGATSVLVEADDPQRGRVALQLVRPLGDPPAERAARIRAAVLHIKHPHVVPVFDVGVVEGHVYVTMERLTGTTLAELLRLRRITEWREILQVFRAAALGLFELHRRGHIHCDFTAHSVFVGTGGRVHVLGFTAVRPAGATTVPPGSVPSTPLEVMEGAEVDARADQFSFCVALYTALYTAPFAGTTATEVWQAMLDGRIETPVELQYGPPPALSAILRRGLKTRPDQRWPDLMQLLQEIDRVVPEGSTGGGRTTTIAATGATVILLATMLRVCAS
jgi:serine/threonine protein kinase